MGTTRSAVVVHPGGPGGPPYFHIPARKLATLLLCTGGGYLLEWFYHNWWAVRLRSGQKLSPIWRSLWFPIFSYPLFKGMRVAAEVHGIEVRFSPLAITLSLGIITLLARFDDLLWPLMYIVCIPLVLVQRVVNRVNERLEPSVPLTWTYSRWEKLLVAGGGLITGLALIGTYLVE